MRTLLVISLIGVWLPAQPLAAQTALQTDQASAPDAIWAYTDDRGRLVHVQRLNDVPARLRSSARRVDQSSGQPVAQHGISAAVSEWLSKTTGTTEPPKREPELYRYRSASGLMVYTNLAASVPSAQRSNARIDLSQVSLNSELGADLDRELAKQHRTLQQSEACMALRAANEEPWWWCAWKEHAPLVVCGGVLLLAVLLTPWMMKRGWGSHWAKVLSTATPVLGFVGLAAFLFLKTSSSMSSRETRAARCESRAFLGASNLQARAQLVQALQAEQQAIEQIHAESMR